LGPPIFAPCPSVRVPIQRGQQQRPQPAFLTVRFLKDIQAQQLGEEIMEDVLGIMMTEGAAAKEAIERVVVLLAESFQALLLFLVGAGSQALNQRPACGGQVA
jgi:hypothetical protein